MKTRPHPTKPNTPAAPIDVPAHDPPPPTNALATTNAAPDLKRVDEVFAWMLRGQAEHDIREAIANHWPDADSQPLVVAAVDRLAESANAPAEVVRGWCMEATRLVYRKALATNSLGDALRAIKMIRDLGG